LTFCQAGKSRSFNGADVNEHIVSAIVGLDKSKTLLAIEPLDSTRRHFLPPKHISRAHHAISFNWSMSLGKSPQAHSTRHSGKSNIENVWVFAAKYKQPATSIDV
jgi:hypothetical protein